jgi:hypothetical protein
MFPRKPHERRLVEIARNTPPPGLARDPILAAHIERTVEMDVAARQRVKQLVDQFPLVKYAGWESSSGFRMAAELRHFWYEYFSRLARFGPTSLPSSFNVLEAFVAYDKERLLFRLRQEREHLLKFSHYLDWYTAGAFPEEPNSLIDIMEEGVAYSYDFIINDSEPQLSAGDARLLLAGVSVIRHGDEVAILLLAGETPPVPARIAKDDTDRRLKEWPDLRPHDEIGEDARLLSGLPNYSRVLLASRFDLSNRLNDVRYVLLDVGNRYDIVTDDQEMLRASLRGRLSPTRFHTLLEKQADTLKRYADLFSAAAAVLFLPAFYIDQHRNVIESQFLTNMGAEQKDSKVKRLRRELGDSYFRPLATIRCVMGELTDDVRSIYDVEPPAMNFQSSGYWKPLDPGQIGTSPDGVPIVGKTWVCRSETWESTTPETFIARRPQSDRDDEYIYVMRSPSHHADVYKIGFTTRDVTARAGELSGSTAAPLPFGVLASWSVRDAKCSLLTA